MKTLSTFFTGILLFLSGVSGVDANWWPNPTPDTYLCQGDECSLEGGIAEAETAIDGLVTDKTFSEYVIQLIQYLTTFITLVGVIIVIYAGFIILFSAGEEEKVKKAKKLILYAVLGILLIWLAYAIMTFIVDVLTGEIQATVPGGGE